MRLRETYVNQIRSWIGINEADGSHKKIIDIYNAHRPLAQGYKVKYTDSWCATTVSAAAIACGYDDIIPLECSCQRLIALAQNMGIWNETDSYKPSAGDIILYDWDDNGTGDDKGWADHIGVVESCDGSTITVIEGNYNNTVGRRKIAVNGRYIRGFVCPKFDKETTATQNNTQYYPKYNGTTTSIADALKSLGIDPSFSNRKAIAAVNNISGYSGTAAQNTTMLNLLKQGKLIKE